MSVPLVCIPGFMCDARLFSQQTAAISSHRALMHVPLTRGRSITEMAETILKITPPHFALLGHALGGMVAMEVMRLAADRVTRLALVGTEVLPETPEMAALREPEIVAAKSGRLDEAIASRTSGYVHDRARKSWILDTIADMARSLGPDVFVRQSRALQKRPDQTETIRKISVPTLVMCGAEDEVTVPRRAEFIAGLVPGATLEVIEDAGHVPMIERPEATNAALERWLTDTLLLR